MKVLLARLLLALSLAVNSVTVLAGGLSGMGAFTNPANEQVSCDMARQQASPPFQAQQDAEDCDRTCCQYSTCFLQHVCTVQHSSFYVAQSAPDLGRPADHLAPSDGTTAVPDFRLPPENPPPIHS